MNWPAHDDWAFPLSATEFFISATADLNSDLKNSGQYGNGWIRSPILDEQIIIIHI